MRGIPRFLPRGFEPASLRRGRSLAHAPARAASAFAAAVAVFLAGAGPASSQPWPLERVLDAVRARDPGYAAAMAERDAGRAQAAAAGSRMLPTLSATAAFLRSDDPSLLFSERLRQGRFTAADFAPESLNDPDARSSWTVGLAVEQPLFDGAAEFTAPAHAGHLRRAADAGAEAAASGRLLEAVARYVEALRARDACFADSLSWLAAEEAARAAVERHRLEEVSELDTLRTAARREETRVTLLDAQRASERALDRLSTLVGERVEAEDIEAPHEGVALVPPEQGEGRSPEIVALREEAAARRIESRRATLRLLPSLHARFSWDGYRDADGGSFEPRTTLGIFAELPLFDAGLRLHERREAQARAREAEARADQVSRDVDAERQDAWRDIEVAGARREAARLGREAAEQALAFALARYRAGLLVLGELLEVEADAADARARQVQADAQATFADYRYLHVTGALR